MTDDGEQTGFPVGGPPGAKAGWYRNRTTGQRRYWNGESWTDISSAITPFTFGPQTAASPPPAVPPPSPPSPEPTKPIDKRRRLVAVSAAALVVVLVIVGAFSLGNNPASPSSSPEASPTTFPFATTTDPFDATTTDPFDTTATAPAGTASPGSAGAPTTSPLATTTPPLTSGIGSSGVTSPTTATSAINVAIIGDSISQIATPDLTRALRQYNVYVDAVGGSLMAEHLAKIQRVVSEGQTTDWVIELGTNDALRENPTWASDFTNEVAALQAQTCVVFVTINPRFGVIGDGINQAIESAVAAHPNFHSLDWGDIQLNKPQWLQSDGIHPTKSGSAELAKLERKAILGCQGR